MPPRLRSLIALALSVLWPALFQPGPAAARDFSHAQKQAFLRAARADEAEIRSGDPARMIAAPPPALFDALARQDGGTPDQARAHAVSETRERLRKDARERFTLAARAAEPRATRDGEPDLEVPTRARLRRIQGPDFTLELRFAAIAFLENGVWRFMRLDAPTNATLLKKAYPRFVGEEFPTADFNLLDQPKRR